MANKDINRILYLFDRPIEPVFVPKGPNKVVFDIAPQYLPERLRPFAEEITKRFCDADNTKIQLKDIAMPDMSIPMKLGRQEMFSPFVGKHADIAGHLINLFMDAETYDDLLSIAARSRDSLNPYLFNYALSVALIHRPDTRNLKLPPQSEIFPGMFFNSSVFVKAKEQATVVPAGSRVPIVIPKDYTATDADVEHRVAYFREDIGVNLHHWHWHLVYPFRADRRIVDKDRRGELFFYMHSQILARYNCERLCNKIGRASKLKNLRDPIPEAYFPKLNAQVASRTWSSRPTGMRFSDVNRPLQDLHYTIADTERWIDRITFAIHKGEVTSATGETIKLTEKNGIDILGNIIEASSISINPALYGDCHNSGHIFTAFIHDPDYRFLEPPGVMASQATTMRDPVFYRWHGHINDILMEYKSTLPEYTDAQLGFPGIEVVKCQIMTQNAPVNTLETFWSQSDIDLAKGLDFAPQGDVLVRVTHLNHTEFKYRIKALNRTNTIKMGTVRIFIAPQLDERGLPFVFRAQEELMIEMDKFTVNLRPGDNVIERKSTDSSVTIPYEKVFRNLDDNSTLDADGTAEFNLCGCGWPQYMLVPRGTLDGYPMVLFVMISNHDDDFVDQAPPAGCNDAASYCGLRNRKYPDARAMGYPFDRRPLHAVQKLSEFLTPNMAIADIHVNFTDVVKPRSRTQGHPA